MFNAGFIEIMNENVNWNLKPGKSYYFTRNGTSIIAFTIGEKCGDRHDPGVNLFKIIGCHSNFPSVKISPNTKIGNNSN